MQVTQEVVDKAKAVAKALAPKFPNSRMSLRPYKGDKISFVGFVLTHPKQGEYEAAYSVDWLSSLDKANAVDKAKRVLSDLRKLGAN